MRTKRRVAETVEQLRRLGIGAPARAVVLEAGMRGFSNELSRVRVTPYRKIHHFSEPLIGGRTGSLLVGGLEGVETVVLEGMVHLFEGYLPGEVVFSVRVLAALGVTRIAFVSRGRALADGVPPGEGFLLATDHLNLTGMTPLKGMRDEERTPFVEPREASAGVRESAAAAARTAGIACGEGVAALIHGPAWPTPAEARMLRRLGADAVSPALAPELAMAAYLGVEAAALLHLGEGAASWGKGELDFCLAFLAGWR
jgi:purine-nucleoside phosphorylase